MGFLVFGIIVVVAAIIVGIAVGNVTKGATGKLITGAGVVVGCFIIVGSCFASVPTGHTGILTTFGKVEDMTFEAGVHFKAPWQEVVNMDNRVQKVTVSLKAFSSDIQEVDVLYTVNYRIDSTQAQNLYKSVGISYETVVIQPAINEAVKTVAAKYTAEKLIESRSELAQGIEEELGKSLTAYNVIVNSTAIENLDFSDEFTNAVEAKQVAAQNKLKAETEQAQKTMEKEAEAERAKIEAAAAAEVAKIQAQADLEVQKINADAAEYTGQKESAKNKAISESLTKDLIQYYYIQQWDGKLPSTYMGSENVSTIVGIGDVTPQ